MNFNILYPKEVLFCGCEILIRFYCPSCDSEELSDPFNARCSTCQNQYKIIDLTKTDLRQVAGHVKVKRPYIGKKIVRKLLFTQENKCAYCYMDLIEYHVEHIKPIYLGGSNSIQNLCISCPRCNMVAGAKYFSTFEDKKDYIIQRRKEIG